MIEKIEVNIEKIFNKPRYENIEQKMWKGFSRLGKKTSIKL